MRPLSSAAPASWARLSAVPRTPDRVPSDATRLHDVGDDRRVDTRHSLVDLTWLNEARLKYGPTVAVIDLSAGGAQIEIASRRLHPGTTVVFELSGRHRTLAIPAHVLRAHVAGIRPHTSYRVALEFKRRFELEIGRSQSRGEEQVDVVHEHARLTLALRRLCDAGGVDRVESVSAMEAATAAALAVTQAAGAHRANNPLSLQIGRLLRVLTNGIASGAAPETMIGHVADCLKRAVPTRSIKLIKADAPLIHSVDAVHFDVPAADGGSPDRLLVEFPRGCHLEPWHLQYLKGAAQLLTVVRETHRLGVPPTEEVIDVPSGWKRVVVRYLDGRLVKGFCDEFSPATGQRSGQPRAERSSRDARDRFPHNSSRRFFSSTTSRGAPRGKARRISVRPAGASRSRSSTASGSPGRPFRIRAMAPASSCTRPMRTATTRAPSSSAPPSGTRSSPNPRDVYRPPPAARVTTLRLLRSSKPTMQDLRYALRTLRKQPVFTIVAVLTLALGIGANTAIFSVVYHMLLRPLPYAHAERLVFVWNSYPKGGSAPSRVSIPDYLDRKADAPALEDAALFTPKSATISTGGVPEQLVALAVTSTFFSTLGRAPRLGRAFTDADVAPGANRVAILTDALWRSRLGADPAVDRPRHPRRRRTVQDRGSAAARFRVALAESDDAAAVCVH